MPGPKAFSSFELEDVIGRGGLGEVWRAVHRPTATAVAVKIATRDHSQPEKAALALEREVAAVASLCHPSIVSIYDYGRGEGGTDSPVPRGSPCLVMELAEGTLADEAWRPRSWEQTRTHLLELLDALAYAHARGIIHRDIKPGNLLISSIEGLKLSDFGLAWSFMTADDARPIGTPAYMAPEQIRGTWRAFGPWTDLYAVGAVAWALVTGSPPFDGDAKSIVHAHLHVEPPTLRARFPVPSGLEAWLRQLLAKSPGARFDRASAAARALLALGDCDATAPAAKQDAPAHCTPGLTTLTSVCELGPSWTELPETPAIARDQGPPPVPEDWRTGAASWWSPQLHGAGLGLYGLRRIPLIGREDARDRLWSALREVASSGRSRVVALRGHAGVGKTRLAKWLAERAHEVGAAEVILSQHEESSGAQLGLLEAFRRFLRCEGLELAEASAQVERLGREHGWVEAGSWDELARVVTSSASADASLAEQHRCLRDLLARVSKRRVVLLILDNAQWADDALRFLAGLTGSSWPVLAVVTVQEEALVERPHEAALLADLMAAGAEEIGLTRLPEAAERRLLESLLGLAPQLIQRVVDRTEGNPLFAVQLVGDWVQRGLLRPGEKGFLLNSDELEPEFPDSLHTLWSRRLAAFSVEQRRCLEVAALLGLTVRRSEWSQACVLAHLPEPGEALLSTLERTRLADLLGESFRFSHGMLRESLLRLAREAGRLVEGHRACAQMLRALDDPRKIGRLGLHLLGAGELEEAMEPLFNGASLARQAGQYGASRRYLETTEALFVRLGRGEDDVMVNVALRNRAAIDWDLGRHDEAAASFLLIRARAVRHGWGPEVTVFSTQDAVQALLHWRDAAEEARDMATEALEVARADAPDDAQAKAEIMVRAEETMGQVELWMGSWERAEGHFHSGLTYTADLLKEHRLQAVGYAEYHLAQGAFMAGRIDRAFELCARATAAFEEASWEHMGGRALELAGSLSLSSGRLDEARTRFEAATDVLRQIEHPDEIRPLCGLVQLGLATEGAQEAQTRLQEALARVGLRRLRLPARRLLALTQARAALARFGSEGHSDSPCRSAVTRALELLDATREADPVYQTALEAMACALDRAGQQDEARRARSLADQQRERLAGH